MTVMRVLVQRRGRWRTGKKKKERPGLCSRLGREEAALSLTVNLTNYSTFLCVQSILIGRKCQPNTTAPSRPVPSFCSGSRRGRMWSRVPPPVRVSDEPTAAHALP